MPDRSSAPATRRDLALVLVVAVLLVLLWTLREVAVLVAFGIVLAYMLDPLVSLLERVPLPRARRLPRGVAAALVMLVLVGLAAWLAALAIPALMVQLVGFLERLPGQVETMVDDLRARAAAVGWSARVEPAIDAMRANLRALLPQLAGLGVRGIAGLFARFDQLLGLAVLPVLTFYLLADREQVRASMLRFLPEGAHGAIGASAGAVHRALRSYVRGQAIVCLAMGTATGAMLAIAHVPNALLLGVLVGLGEIIPFLGFLFAALAIVLSGLRVDPALAAIGIAIYVFNNWLLGTFVTPRVMSRYLKMHPFAVIVSVLAGAKLLGPPGAILALPAAAVTQALIEEFVQRRAAGRGR